MRFSRRVPPSFEPSRWARLISQSPPSFDLTLSNPTRVGLDYPESLLAPLANPEAVRYQPLPWGLRATRESIAALYPGPIDPDRVCLTSSTSESYSWLFKLLFDPGDQILVPRPSYPLFECLAHLDSVEVVQYPLIESIDWAIDFTALHALATPRTRAIVVVNPNNPTGSFLKRWELDPLAAFCRARSLALISDEVFAPYAFRDDPARVATLATETRCPVFVLNGLSKLAGLPQMKLGWILAPPEATAALEWIADAYLPVSSPVQLAAPSWLQSMPEVSMAIRARTAANLDCLRRSLQDSPARLLPPEAGWSAVVELPRTRTEEEWAALFLERGTLVQPGFFYDFEREAFAVLSLLPDPETFRNGVNQIRLTLIENLS